MGSICFLFCGIYDILNFIFLFFILLAMYLLSYRFGKAVRLGDIISLNSSGPSYFMIYVNEENDRHDTRYYKEGEDRYNELWAYIRNISVKKKANADIALLQPEQPWSLHLHYDEGNVFVEGITPHTLYISGKNSGIYEVLKEVDIAFIKQDFE